jgi:hypothetical protein
MPLVVGQWFAPAKPERDFALHVSGREAASLFVVSFALHGRSDPTKCGRNARVHTVRVLIQAPAGEFSSPSGRLVLERLTMPSGSTLPPDQANPLVWSGVAEGALGMTLAGQMPFLWELGQERTFRPGQAWPQIPGPGPNPLMAGGTQVALRNTGTSPRVLYRLTLTPTTGTVAAAA